MRDPLPRDAPWLAPARPGEPLWRSVDFADAVDAADRAGIEGALLAAGLLTATVETDGSVRAADGELLLSPTAARPSRRLSTVLRPDPACGLPSDLIATVLESIGLDDDTAPTSVALDGSWHNGPLRGRHVLPAARHIGAAARAAHRRARLAEIEAALAELDAEAQLRREDVQALDAREDRLDRHLRTAPRSADLHAARRLQAQPPRGPPRATSKPSRSPPGRVPGALRWAAELSTHHTTCAHHGLPAEADAWPPW